MELTKKGCLALVVTIVSSLVLAEQSQAEALADYNNGTAYFEMGRLQEAIRWFDKSIAYGTKGFAEPYINKGFCLQKLGYHDRAILCYDAAIKINPKLAIAYQNRGTAYLHLNRYAESLRDLNKAISMPRASSLSSVTIYIDRGRAYAGLRRWKESFADFDYVLSMQATTGNMVKLKSAAAEEKRKAQLLMAQSRQEKNTTSSATARPTTPTSASTSSTKETSTTPTSPESSSVSSSASSTSSSQTAPTSSSPTTETSSSPQTAPNTNPVAPTSSPSQTTPATPSSSPTPATPTNASTTNDAATP